MQTRDAGTDRAGKIDAMTYEQYKTDARDPYFKNVVLTLVERGGLARSFHIDNVSVASVMPILNVNLQREIALMMESAALYGGQIGKQFARHEYVDHSAYEWCRGNVHSNTVEGFYSNFKRRVKGVYQHCSEKHLHPYLAEFDFCYSNRVALGIDDEAWAVKALDSVRGKRLTYKASAGVAANRKYATSLTDNQLPVQRRRRR